MDDALLQQISDDLTVLRNVDSSLDLFKKFCVNKSGEDFRVLGMAISNEMKLLAGRIAHLESKVCAKD